MMRNIPLVLVAIYSFIYLFVTSKLICPCGNVVYWHQNYRHPAFVISPT